MFMSSMMGGGLKQVQLNGTASQHTRVNASGDCYAGVSLNANGNEYAFSNAGSQTGSLLQAWLLDGSAGDYYARCTVTADSIDAGSSAEDTWLQLNGTRNWYVIDETIPGGEVTATITIDIAGGSGGTPLYATDSYALSATQTN